MILGALKAAKALTPMGWAQLLWKPVLALALVYGFYLWAHGRGESAGREEGAATLAKVSEQRARALADLDTAKAANATQITTIATLKASNAHWASEADRLADEGLAAVQAEERRAAKAEAEAKKWSDRYARESAKPPCAAAQAELARACAALKDY